MSEARASGGTTNRRRVDRVERLLAGLFYTPRNKTIAPDDREAALIDALTDLRHFARFYGLNWDRAANDLALRHHAEESRYDWDAEQL